MTSTPAGINCGPMTKQCAAQFVEGDRVALQIESTGACRSLSCTVPGPDGNPITVTGSCSFAVVLKTDVTVELHCIGAP